MQDDLSNEFKEESASPISTPLADETQDGQPDVLDAPLNEDEEKHEEKETVDPSSVVQSYAAVLPHSICPVTGQVITNPMISTCGHAVDKSALGSIGSSCPTCQKEVNVEDYIPCHLLGALAQESYQSLQSSDVDDQTLEIERKTEQTKVEIEEIQSEIKKTKRQAAVIRQETEARREELGGDVATFQNWTRAWKGIAVFGALGLAAMGVWKVRQVVNSAYEGATPNVPIPSVPALVLAAGLEASKQLATQILPATWMSVVEGFFPSQSLSPLQVEALEIIRGNLEQYFGKEIKTDASLAELFCLTVTRRRGSLLGEVNTIATLIKLGFPIDKPLNPQMLEAWGIQGIDNAQNIYPMHLAVRSHIPGLMKLLLQSGAKVKCQDSQQKTLFHYMAMPLHYMAMPHLPHLPPDHPLQADHLFRNRPHYRTAVHDLWALLYHNEFHAGAQKVSLDTPDADGKTALDIAIASGNTEVAIALALYGATIHPEYLTPENINATGFNGRTLLHGMVAAGQLDNAALLIQYGENVNAQDHDGNTPLHYAVLTNIRIVKLLLDHNADLSIQNKDGLTPFCFIVNDGQPSVVEWFLEQKLVTIEEMQKALGIAHTNQDHEMVRLISNAMPKNVASVRDDPNQGLGHGRFFRNTPHHDEEKQAEDAAQQVLVNDDGHDVLMEGVPNIDPMNFGQ